MIRWYISPYSGTGKIVNGEADPFHASAWDLTDPVNDEVRGMFCSQRRHYIVRVRAPESTHNQILISAKGIPVSPLFEDNAENLDAVISGDELTNAENAGYNHAGVATKTLRNLLRYYYRTVVVSQILNKHPLAERLFTLGLNSTVADLTAQQRTAVRNWMTSKSMDITWIKNTSTLREVLHFIVSNLQIGTIRVAGKEF